MKPKKPRPTSPGKKRPPAGRPAAAKPARRPVRKSSSNLPQVKRKQVAPKRVQRLSARAAHTPKQDTGPVRRTGEKAAERPGKGTGLKQATTAPTPLPAAFSGPEPSKSPAVHPATGSRPPEVAKWKQARLSLKKPLKPAARSEASALVPKPLKDQPSVPKALLPTPLVPKILTPKPATRRRPVLPRRAPTVVKSVAIKPTAAAAQEVLAPAPNQPAPRPVTRAPRQRTLGKFKSASAPPPQGEAAATAPKPAPSSSTVPPLRQSVPIGLSAEEQAPAAQPRVTEPAPAPVQSAPAELEKGELPRSQTRPAPAIAPPVLQLEDGTKIPPILWEGDEPARVPIPIPTRRAAFEGAPAAAQMTFLGTSRGPDLVAPSQPSPEPELPETYGTGRLFLTARDPHCLHARWDLTQEQQRKYLEASAGRQLILRLYQGGVGGPLECEDDVHPESRSWFLHPEWAGHTFVAELGYYRPGGEWHGIAVSEPTTTPRGSVSHDTTFTLATLTTAAIPHVVAPGRASGEPPLILLPPASASAPSAGAPGTPAQQKERTAYRETLPAGAQVPASPPTAPPEWSRGEAPRIEPLAAPGERWAESVERSRRPLELTGWSEAQEEALAELVGMTVIRQDWPASAEIAEVIKARRKAGQAQPVSVSSAELALPSGVPGEITSPAGAEWPQPTSPAGGELPVPKSFWFNVNAELIIYGATEPDATVSIGGRKIRLRPDGTFSYRFALPDGQYALPVSAVASHGDSRRADLSFRRATVYSGEVGAHPQDAALKTPAPEHVA